MRNEFAFNQIQSVEFCVNVHTNGGSRASYLVPIDQSVLLEMLDDRRYTTALKPGAKPAFVASSRRRTGRNREPPDRE
jgi:hypothetical protein